MGGDRGRGWTAAAPNAAVPRRRNPSSRRRVDLAEAEMEVNESE